MTPHHLAAAFAAFGERVRQRPSRNGPITAQIRNTSVLQPARRLHLGEFAFRYATLSGEMPMRWATLVALVISCISPLRADSQPTGGNGKTVVYDVTALTRQSGATAEKLARVILTSVDPESWVRGNKFGASLEIMQRTKLQIRAAPDVHEQIADLLSQLRKASEIRVGFEAELHELSPEFFKKEVGPLLTKDQMVVVGTETVALIQKHKGRLQIVRANAPSGDSIQVFSQKQAFTFVERQSIGRKEFGIEFHGVGLRGEAAVSGDRRFVFLKLTRTTSELVSVKEMEIQQPHPVFVLETVKIEKPDLREEKHTQNLKLEDGATLLLTIPPTSRLEKDHGKVRVLLVRIVIGIEEEKGALKKSPTEK
jgi:hypothetical protein